jgi:hypothetical protein
LGLLRPLSRLSRSWTKRCGTTAPPAPPMNLN